DKRRPLALLDPNHAAAELERQRALLEAASVPDDTAFVLFTSGSTSQPRGVVLSRRAIEAACDASAKHLGWRDDDRWLLALSLAHTGGLAVVVRCRFADKPIVIAGDDLARSLAKATLASLVPTQLASLLDDPVWRPPPRLRAVLLGGAGAPPTLLEAAAARGVPFLTTYGMTETFGQVATAPVTRAGDPRALPVPLAGVMIDAAPQIRIAGRMLATCYLDGAPIAPAFTTADLGEFGSDGLRVIGRVDDVIVTGGDNVQPAEVEAVLAATPGVRAACVFAIPDVRWGAIVGAAIVGDASFDLEAARALWYVMLPARARPRRLATVDALPRLPSGKLDRHAAAALDCIAIAYAAESV
ncbi:MAG TPA: AMP-binding protein, partial [Kofleriaceae bacterium]|nr:AMP-binding protein [Kofleriaceae bacterium]